MDNITALCELTDILIENASYDCPAGLDKLAELFEKNGGLPGAKAQAESIIGEYLDRPIVPGITLRQRNGGYYVDLPFSETDITVLKSMLLSVPYCERWQLSQIYERLESFLPAYMRDDDSIVYTNTDKYDGTFYENMSVIIRALYPAEGSIRKLKFDYCGYNTALELEPRVSSFDGSSRRTVDPIKVVCTNGFFYLVTFYIKDDEIKFINYRIDRMKNVECSDIPAESFEAHLSEQRQYILNLKRKIDQGRRDAKLKKHIFHEPNDDASDLDETRRIDSNGFNLGEYIFRSKIMYTDKMLDKVQVRLDKRSLNGVIDLFGFDIDAEPFDESVITVSLHNVSEITVIKWAMQYSDEVEIIEPLSLRSAIAVKAAQLAKKYGQGDSNEAE